MIEIVRAFYEVRKICRVKFAGLRLAVCVIWYHNDFIKVFYKIDY